MDCSSDIQNLTISSDKWSVGLYYEDWSCPVKTIKNSGLGISLSEATKWSSTLKITLTDNKLERNCILRGIEGSTYLYKNNNNQKGQSVKIDGDNLILSLGRDFISMDLNKLKLNWRLRPDMAEVFEFYDLENDYLLRGEVGIHRIDKSGRVKWTFSASDIWVNLEGKPEVNVTDKTIKLLDFNSNEYEIDFDGKEISK